MWPFFRCLLRCLGRCSRCTPHSSTERGEWLTTERMLHFVQCFPRSFGRMRFYSYGNGVVFRPLARCYTNLILWHNNVLFLVTISGYVCVLFAENRPQFAGTTTMASSSSVFLVWLNASLEFLSTCAVEADIDVRQRKYARYSLIHIEWMSAVYIAW